MTATKNLPLDKSEETPPGREKKRHMVQPQSKCESLTLPRGFQSGTEVTEYIRLVTF